MNTHRLTCRHAAAFAVLAVAGSLVAGCLTTGRSMPTARQLVDGGIVEAQADLDTLHRGRALAMTACIECHRQYFPQEYHPNRWPFLAQEMGEMSNLRPDQIRALRAYMVAASKTRTQDEDETEATEL